VRVAERGQPAHVFLAYRVTPSAQLLDGGIQVPGVPQHDRVQNQAQGAELVLLPFPVRPVDLPAPSVEVAANGSKSFRYSPCSLSVPGASMLGCGRC